LFLDSFAVENGKAGKLSILKDYLHAQKPSDEEDKAAIYLADLMQTWSFASQSNNESLLSAVPAVLALLLRTISHELEFSNYGLTLGRTLLQKPQQELIARGLISNKTKEFLISPVLRLLREVTTFDGGVLAKQVFRARDQTFKNLARNLNLRYTGDGVEDRRKPSVRTNALLFLLSALKFLPADAKRELLHHRDIVSAVTKDIKDDPPFMVREILVALKVSVLQDDTLPRDAKTKILNATSFGRIAMLYRYDQPDEEFSAGMETVGTAAHEFLLLACTSPDIGVLNRQTGFYPRGINPDETTGADIEHDFINLGLDSIEWMDKYTEKVPVRNSILAEFIQNLRPWSSTKQSDLLLAILRSAPELVAEYFFSRKGFTFDPRLTATWIGYSTFLFSTIQLPIPKYFGYHERYARLPPPSSIVLESLLPQPLNQKVLTRCLNQNDKLITFCAVRLLCIAFTKFQDVLKMYNEAAGNSSPVWSQAAKKLSHEFCQRCPSIKDIINAFRNISNTDLMQREAITRLLVSYYKVVPQIALDAKFDVSATLAETLLAMKKGQESCILRAMELENLFQFAHFSPGMRWFAKMDGHTISPFMAMIELSVDPSSNIPLPELRPVLDSVAEENQIFQTQTAISALATFMIGLRGLSETENGASVFNFLDDCVSRCAAKPIKYMFNLEEIHQDVHGSDEKNSIVSLLTLVIVEQWPFVVKSTADSVLREMAKYLAGYLAASIKIGEDTKIIKLLINKLAAGMLQDSEARTLIEHCRKWADTAAVSNSQPGLAVPVQKSVKKKGATETDEEGIAAEILEDPIAQAEDHSALVKWATKEVNEVIEGGYAGALISLLSSEHLGIRKEAVTNISKFSAKLKESAAEEKEQIWLLLLEVIETTRKVINQEPLPTILSSFASHAIMVLNDPLHCLYPKINKFLSQGPTWDLDKIPLMYKILYEAPSLDDAHYLETAWLLKYLLDGLGSAVDMAIYRKRRVFEKLFSLYSNPYLGPSLREKILKILFRASTITGGSTTLITRSSTMTWLQVQVALSGGVSLETLMGRLLESCDQERVSIWSNHGAAEMKPIL
jgi:nucleolar pre-ribosomal-associated protein 1